MRFRRAAFFGLVALTMGAAPFAHAAGAGSGSGIVAGGGAKAEKSKAKEAEPAKEAETEEMKKAMAQKVSFGWVETPLSDGVAFISKMSSVNVVLDPKLGTDEKMIDLAVKELPLREALDKIAALADAKVFVKDGGYYIGTEAPEGAPQPPPKLTEEQAKAVEDAIAKLGSEDFPAREAATKAINDAGPGALPQVEAALKKTDDAEATSRLKEIAEAFRLQLGGDKGSVALKKALERKISFEFEDAPLEDAVNFLNSLVEGSGAKIVLSTEAPRNTPISLRVNDMKMSMALEWIAKLADCRLVKNGNTVTVSK